MAEVLSLDRERARRGESQLGQCPKCAADGLTPPMDLDAEAAVLADMIHAGAGHYDLVKDFLQADMFYSEAHRQIFLAIEAIAGAGQTLDLVTLLSSLKQRERIDQVGHGYPIEMLNATPAVANIVPHARIVHDRWRERQAIAACQRIAARGYQGVEDTQEFLDAATSSLSDVARASVAARLESNVDAIKRIIARASERSQMQSKIPIGLATGIRAFDDEWGGLHGTDLTVFLAKKGTGKTSLAVQLLAHVTRPRPDEGYKGVAALLFSSDSTFDQLTSDLVSHEARVDSRQLRRGDLGVAGWRAITEAASALGSRTYFIDDARSMTISQVRARALATADECNKRLRIPLGLVIFDYYQQLKNHLPNPYAKKVDWLGSAAEEFKSLARAMGIPIVVFAQQKPDDRGKPVYAAKECARIEDEADNLHVIEKLARDRRRLRSIKVRRGDDPIIELAFDGPSRTFSDAQQQAVRDFVDQGPPLWPEEDCMLIRLTPNTDDRR